MTEQTPPSSNSSEKATALQADEVKILVKELEKEREKSSDYINRFKYLQADFENYKRRVEKQINETAQYGNRRLILELLSILDELECAVEAGKKGGGKALLEGVKMTLTKLYNILEREGVSKIETVGKPFDPNRHEAVLRVQMEGKDGIIIEEVRKGFMLRDMVLRPSLVKVAVEKPEKVKENE